MITTIKEFKINEQSNIYKIIEFRTQRNDIDTIKNYINQKFPNINFIFQNHKNYQNCYRDFIYTEFELDSLLYNDIINQLKLTGAPFVDNKSKIYN